MGFNLRYDHAGYELSGIDDSVVRTKKPPVFHKTASSETSYAQEQPSSSQEVEPTSDPIPEPILDKLPDVCEVTSKKTLSSFNYTLNRSRLIY